MKQNFVDSLILNNFFKLQAQQKQDTQKKLYYNPQNLDNC
jgi:hypothetical protein